jgi:pimeloyl-ACP methyl ester carboxylesterase
MTMVMARWQDSIIEANGVRLHVVEAGNKEAPLVILLHGFPDFWYGWRRQIGPLVQAGYLVVVPDQRGYNLSDKPAGIEAYLLDTLALDVLKLADHYNRDKVLLVGHDWGAAVAWQFATHYPERLEKLVILNVPHPVVMVRTLKRNLKQLLRSWYIFFFQLQGLSEWLLSCNDYQGLLNLLKGSANKGSFSNDDLEKYRSAYRQPGALTAMLNWYRAMFRQGVKSRYQSTDRPPKKIKVPTLMLWGARDIALSLSMAGQSINLCEEGQLVVYENASHWVQHDEFERINSEILNFFSVK